MGLECLPVEVEVDISKGQTAFSVVGLPDASINEARSRIHSAIKNSGYDYPFNFRILINLAPASARKEGTSFDLAMAAGMIMASSESRANLSNAVLTGELSLDGALRHVNGILPLTLFAKNRGLKKIFLPAVDAPEAGLVDGLEIYPVKNLRQLLEHIDGKTLIAPYARSDNPDNYRAPEYELDMALIKGQEFAKRALEIAASGAHNILMSGPPGSGKTLLARTLPSVLPRLTSGEVLEVTKIYSVAGLLQSSFITERPFRSPHHTASGVALVGGGRYPRPGEISLSHRGVLFLDEFPEFSHSVLENLRQPLEDGTVTVSRAEGSVTYPARFILVASQNPCPCGFYSDPERQCTCGSAQILRYRKKISGPLLDRIDLHVEVPRVKFDKLASDELAESSEKIRQRVEETRARQNQRFRGLPVAANSDMRGVEIRQFCKLDDSSIDLLRAAMTQMRLSARAYNRVLKLSRTIADLAKSDDIKLEHVAEALQYRAKE